MSRTRLNVEINSKMYMLSCTDDERERLQQVAAAVDAKVRAVAEANGVSGQGAFVLALLSNQEELLQITEENDALAGRVAELRDENTRLQQARAEAQQALEATQAQFKETLLREKTTLRDEMAEDIERLRSELARQRQESSAHIDRLEAEAAELRYTLRRRNEGAPDPETEALQATLRRIGDRLNELSKRVNTVTQEAS